MALVVGINQYKPVTGLGKLNYAVNDATAIKDLLRNRMGFRENSIHLLTDQSDAQTNEDNVPTYENLVRATDTFVHSLTPESVAVVYYSGHGMRQGSEDYWIPSNGNVQNPQKLCVSASELLARIYTKKPRRVVFFFDACRDLDATEDAGVRGIRVIGLTPPRMPVALGETAVLYGCKEGQASRECKSPPESWKQGIFTHYLKLALEGDPAAAEPGTENITFSRLRLYLQTRVSNYVQQFNAKQEPDGHAKPESMVLARAQKQLRPDVEALLNRADSALRDGNGKEGLDRAQEAINIQDSGRGRYLLGRANYMLKRYEDALQQCYEARKLGYKHRLLLQTIAEAAKALEETAPAGSTCFAAPPVIRELRLGAASPSVLPAFLQGADAQDARALISEAVRLFEVGQLDGASKAAQSAVTADPRSAEAWLILGRISFMKKEYPEAIQAFQRAQGIGPNLKGVQEYLRGARKAQEVEEARSLVDQASSLLINRRFEEAEAALRASLERMPENAEAFEVLGSLRLDQKRPAEAIVAYEQALRVDPTRSFAREQLEFAQGEQKREAAARLVDEAARLLAVDVAAAKSKAMAAQERDPRNVAIHLLLARIYRQERDYSNAIREYQEALAVHPGMPEALAGLQETLATKPAETVPKLLQEVLRLLPTDPGAAEHPAREAIARDQANAAAWAALADVHKRLAEAKGLAREARAKHYQDASREYQQALLLQPGLEPAIRGLERVLQGQRVLYAAGFADDAYRLLVRDRPLDAAVKARAALVENAQDADAHAALGYAFLMTGEQAAAEASIRRALELDAANKHLTPLAHVAQATNLYLAGKLHEAEQELEAALRAEPKHVLGLNNLGAVYAKRGRLDEAERQWELAIEYDPDYGYGYANLGSRYFNHGKWEKAAGAYEQAIRLNGQNGLFRAWHAAALLRLGRKEAARAEAEEALRLGVLKHPVYKPLGIKP